MAAEGAGQPAARHPLPFRLLRAPPTDWDPATASVALNLRLDGCIVPSEASEQGARIAYSHAVVIDDFIQDATRQQLLDFLLLCSPQTAAAERGSGAAQPLHPSQSERWERRTTDMAGGAPTWGVKQHVLQELLEGQLPALQEVYGRLHRLYPECDIAHLPSDAIQLQQCQPSEASQQQGARQQDDGQQAQHKEPPAKRGRLGSKSGGKQHAPGNGSAACPQPAVDCACFVANAAVEGDSFAYHVDADTTSFPDGSAWHAAYGDYFNGEPGRPLLVSLLLYLSPEWRREWGAETLLLDGQTDTGVFVGPRPCRALLIDQDMLHRVSPPSAAAEGRPRFSLVWKLVLLPRQPGQQLCLARPEWGLPVSFGSAARVDAVKRQLAAERRGKVGA